MNSDDNEDSLPDNGRELGPLDPLPADMPDELKALIREMRAQGKTVVLAHGKNRGTATFKAKPEESVGDLLRQLLGAAESDEPLTPGHPANHAGCIYCQVNEKFNKIHDSDLTGVQKFEAAIHVLRLAEEAVDMKEHPNLRGDLAGQRLLLQSAKIVNEQSREFIRDKREAAMANIRTGLEELNTVMAGDHHRLEGVLLKFGIARVWNDLLNQSNEIPRFRFNDNEATGLHKQVDDLIGRLMADPDKTLKEELPGDNT